jgi:hypothetical protein
MRSTVLGSLLLAGLVAGLALATSEAAIAQNSALPYDPYKWCAVYNLGRHSGSASNCGFKTLAQCQQTISGVGGTCEPNQFYNPGKSRKRAHR